MVVNVLVWKYRPFNQTGIKLSDLAAWGMVDCATDSDMLKPPKSIDKQQLASAELASQTVQVESKTGQR